MMKYEYGVEYETNGERPDLPDDVVVDIKSTRWEAFGGVNKPIHVWYWPDVEKLKVTDERYKPKDQVKGEITESEGKEYFMPTSPGPVINAGSIAVSEIPESKSNRTERKIAIHLGQQAWLKHLKENEIEWSATDLIKCLYDAGWRPVKSERDKVIVQAEHEIESQTGNPAIITHLGILYDAGMLKLPE